MHDSEIICEVQKGPAQAPELVAHLRTAGEEPRSLGHK